jgi:hypothetical protein
MERKFIVRMLQIASEAMGGRAPSDEALTVIAARLETLTDTDVKAAIAHMTENARSFSARGSDGCSANGCILPGTINSGGGWSCRFHRHCGSDTERDAVTAYLRRNSGHVSAMWDAMRLGHERIDGVSGRAIAGRIGATLADACNEIREKAAIEHAQKRADAHTNEVNGIKSRLGDFLKRATVPKVSEHATHA